MRPLLSIRLHGTAANKPNQPSVKCTQAYRQQLCALQLTNPTNSDISLRTHDVEDLFVMFAVDVLSPSFEHLVTMSVHMWLQHQVLTIWQSSRLSLHHHNTLMTIAQI